MAEDPLETVLRLVAEGRLTAEEASPILEALDAAQGPKSGGSPDSSASFPFAGSGPMGMPPGFGPSFGPGPGFGPGFGSILDPGPGFGPGSSLDPQPQHVSPARSAFVAGATSRRSSPPAPRGTRSQDTCSGHEWQARLADEASHDASHRLRCESGIRAEEYNDRHGVTDR